MKPRKPLGGKTYNSIPHFSVSRTGPGDHFIDISQELWFFESPKDKGSRVIVQEKLDGSNVCVANIDDKIVALNRAGYLCSSSRWVNQRFFDWWVDQHLEQFHALLKPGERIAGEWLAQAHGTMYDLSCKPSPFVAFDLFFANKERAHLKDFLGILDSASIDVGELFSLPPLIAETTNEGYPLDKALRDLGDFGHFGAQETVEGLVYRLERPNKPTLLCKYVKPEKVDGKYFDKERWLWPLFSNTFYEG